MRSRWLAGLILLLGLPQVAAQEPTFMEAATHPGSGQLYGRFVWISRPFRGTEPVSQLDLKSAYGITRRLALLPFMGVDEDGVTDASLRLKFRILQHDTGPIDTWRVSLQGGGEWFDGRQASARAGIVSTTIRGRHGINAQADWHDADRRERRFQLNASHLYRIAPAQYAATTMGAWYTMVESLNVLDRSGDNESDVAVGILYEARRWAAEASLRFMDPAEAISRRQTRLGVGLRALL